MELKKILFTFSFLFISLISFSQQIGDGSATGVSDFNIELPSGFYQGNNAAGHIDGGGWNHLLNLRHSNTANNHQLQIASSYTENDRLFFRKFARLTGTSNPDWHEIATRDGNTFNGDQIINGNVGIGTISPQTRLNVNIGAGGVNSTAGIRVGGLGNYPSLELGIDGDYDGMIRSYGNNINYYAGHWRNKGVTASENHSHNWFTSKTGSTDWSTIKMILNQDGNLEIGTTTPDQKLTVNGTIHAKEIIVDTNFTPDYVFQKYYTGKSTLKSDYVMPTLAEIESFTKKNHHLPNVPSAQEVQQNGVSLGTMSNVLLQKVEELTLYVIEMKKENENLKKENSLIKTQQLELTKRIKNIENK